MYYLLVAFCFKSVFYSDSSAEARTLARSIARERNLHSYLVYNRLGELIDEYDELG